MDWRGCANAECRGRLRAEQTNVRLKEALDHLQKLHNKLLDTLRHGNALYVSCGSDFCDVVWMAIDCSLFLSFRFGRDTIS